MKHTPVRSCRLRGSEMLSQCGRPCLFGAPPHRTFNSKNLGFSPGTTMEIEVVLQWLLQKQHLRICHITRLFVLAQFTSIYQKNLLASLASNHQRFSENISSFFSRSILPPFRMPRVVLLRCQQLDSPLSFCIPLR